MQIIEMTCMVGADGALSIPSDVLSETGIMPGNTVRLAYISEYGNDNTFREFLLTANGVSALPGEYDPGADTLVLPDKLLECAGIDPSGDVTVVCQCGAVVIYDADIVGAEDFAGIAELLGIDPANIDVSAMRGGDEDDK